MPTHAVRKVIKQKEKFHVRMMLKVQIPVDTGNEALASGALPDVIKKTMAKLKPEAAYFFPQDGDRSCIMVFDLQDVSQLPTITEPFFMQLNAAVEVIPVMNLEDLMKGLSQIGK